MLYYSFMLKSQSFVLILFGWLLLSFDANALTITHYLKRPNHSLVLNKGKEVVTYVPNSSFHVGIKIIGSAFFFQYSWKIPNSNFGRSNIGNDKYRDLRLGIYPFGHLLEAFYTRYEGFSSTENGGNPACNNCLIRNSLTSQEALIQYIIPTSEDLDLRDIVSGARASVQSGWSGTYHFFANRLKTRDEVGLIQGDFLVNHSEFNDLREFDFYQYGFGFGLGGVLALGEYLYFGGLTSIGGGYQKNIFTYQDHVQKELAEYGLNYNFRFIIGTHRDGVNVGLRGHIVSNLFDVGEKTSFVSVNNEVRLYLSYNF